MIKKKPEFQVMALPSDTLEISSLKAWHTVERKSALSVRAVPNIRATNLNDCKGN